MGFSRNRIRRVRKQKKQSKRKAVKRRVRRASRTKGRNRLAHPRFKTLKRGGARSAAGKALDRATVAADREKNALLARLEKCDLEQLGPIQAEAEDFLADGAGWRKAMREAKGECRGNAATKAQCEKNADKAEEKRANEVRAALDKCTNKHVTEVPDPEEVDAAEKEAAANEAAAKAKRETEDAAKAKAEAEAAAKSQRDAEVAAKAKAEAAAAKKRMEEANLLAAKPAPRSFQPPTQLSSLVGKGAAGALRASRQPSETQSASAVLAAEGLAESKKRLAAKAAAAKAASAAQAASVAAAAKEAAAAKAASAAQAASVAAAAGPPDTVVASVQRALAHGRGPAAKKIQRLVRRRQEAQKQAQAAKKAAEPAHKAVLAEAAVAAQTRATAKAAGQVAFPGAAAAGRTFAADAAHQASLRPNLPRAGTPSLSQAPAPVPVPVVSMESHTSGDATAATAAIRQAIQSVKVSADDLLKKAKSECFQSGHTAAIGELRKEINKALATLAKSRLTGPRWWRWTKGAGSGDVIKTILKHVMTIETTDAKAAQKEWEESLTKLSTEEKKLLDARKELDKCVKGTRDGAELKGKITELNREWKAARDEYQPLSRRSQSLMSEIRRHPDKSHEEEKTKLVVDLWKLRVKLQELERQKKEIISSADAAFRTHAEGLLKEVGEGGNVSSLEHMENELDPQVKPKQTKQREVGKKATAPKSATQSDKVGAYETMKSVAVAMLAELNKSVKVDTSVRDKLVGKWTQQIDAIQSGGAKAVSRGGGLADDKQTLLAALRAFARGKDDTKLKGQLGSLETELDGQIKAAKASVAPSSPAPAPTAEQNALRSSLDGKIAGVTFIINKKTKEEGDAREMTDVERAEAIIKEIRSACDAMVAEKCKVSAWLVKRGHDTLNRLIRMQHTLTDIEKQITDALAANPPGLQEDYASALRKKVQSEEAVLLKWMGPPNVPGVIVPLKERGLLQELARVQTHSGDALERVEAIRAEFDKTVSTTHAMITEALKSNMPSQAQHLFSKHTAKMTEWREQQAQKITAYLKGAPPTTEDKVFIGREITKDCKGCLAAAPAAAICQQAPCIQLVSLKKYIDDEKKKLEGLIGQLGKATDKAVTKQLVGTVAAATTGHTTAMASHTAAVAVAQATTSKGKTAAQVHASTSKIQALARGRATRKRSRATAAATAPVVDPAAAATTGAVAAPTDVGAAPVVDAAQAKKDAAQAKKDAAAVLKQDKAAAKDEKKAVDAAAKREKAEKKAEQETIKATAMTIAKAHVQALHGKPTPQETVGAAPQTVSLLPPVTDGKAVTTSTASRVNEKGENVVTIVVTYPKSAASTMTSDRGQSTAEKLGAVERTIGSPSTGSPPAAPAAAAVVGAAEHTDTPPTAVVSPVDASAVAVVDASAGAVVDASAAVVVDASAAAPDASAAVADPATADTSGTTAVSVADSERALVEGSEFRKDAEHVSPVTPGDATEKKAVAAAPSSGSSPPASGETAVSRASTQQPHLGTAAAGPPMSRSQKRRGQRQRAATRKAAEALRHGRSGGSSTQKRRRRRRGNKTQHKRRRVRSRKPRNLTNKR